MQRLRNWQYPLSIAAVWAVVAWASLTLREDSEGVLLLCLPSAVAVAALAERKRSDWPRCLIALFVAQIAVWTGNGVQLLDSMGLGIAQIVAATTCVTIARGVLRRHVIPQTIGHLAGIFAGATLASLASTILAAPFWPHSGALQLTWWFLTVMLGILVGVPILFYLRHLLGAGQTRIAVVERNPPVVVGTIFLGSLFLSLLILSGNTLTTIPLLFGGLIFAVLRAGQMGAAVAVFGFAVAATVGWTTGLVSRQTFGFEPLVACLTLQGYMALMLVGSLPLASVLMRSERLEQALRRRNQDLQQSMTILKLAKTLAGIGRWQYDCRTGAQAWSPQMLEMNGLSPELAPDPGDVRSLLADGGKEYFAQLAAHRDSRIPYSFEYKIRTSQGDERILR